MIRTPRITYPQSQTQKRTHTHTYASSRPSATETPNDRVSRWLDQRNQSRIAQFEANRVALLASATSSSSSPSQSTGVALGGGGAVDEGAGREEQEEEIDPKTKTFGTTAEFAGLAARLLHVGVGQVS